MVATSASAEEDTMIINVLHLVRMALLEVGEGLVAVEVELSLR